MSNENDSEIYVAEHTGGQETARDWSQAQDWAGMDGATAFLLIDRHADGWGDTRAMMEAWLAANSTQTSSAPESGPAQSNPHVAKLLRCAWCGITGGHLEDCTTRKGLRQTTT